MCIRDRDGSESTDSKHSTTVEIVGRVEIVSIDKSGVHHVKRDISRCTFTEKDDVTRGGNTAAQPEAHDSSRDDSDDTSSDGRAELLTGPPHHHHRKDQLPDSCLEVTPVNDKNKLLGLRFSSTDLPSLKTGTTADSHIQEDNLRLRRIRGETDTEIDLPVSGTDMNMATYNTARFSAAQGVLHRQFGSFTLQASSQSLKNFSLHKSFEEWFDNTRMVASINLINGTTGPIMLTYTGLEMGSLMFKDWLVDWVEMVSTIVNFTNARPDLDSLALSSSSLSSPLSGMSKSRMFHQRYQDPYSLASLTKEDLQLLTHACTLLFSKNMARVVVNTNEFTRSDISIMITYTVLGEDLERLTHDCTPLCTCLLYTSPSPRD